MPLSELDKTDCKILYELDKNARASYASIAKQVRLSKQAVQKRVERLVSSGIISHFITVINMANFGVMPTQVYLTLRRSSEERKKAFVAYLLQHPSIPQIGLSDGPYDIFFGISARSQADIDDILASVYSHFPDMIEAKKIVQFVDTRLFTREYLLDKKRKLLPANKGFHSRETKPQPIKEIDGRILMCLAGNPRVSFLDVGRTLHTSAQTVINRVKYMEKHDVIRGYMYLLTEQMFIQHNILLELQTLTKEVQGQLFEYFASHPNVIFVAKLIGAYDLSLITECKDFNDYRRFSEDFKSMFSPYIKKFIPLLITGFPKLNFMPPL